MTKYSGKGVDQTEKKRLGGYLYVYNILRYLLLDIWDHIKMLVRRKVNTVPMHVYPNNELVSDYETVFHTWKDNFSDFYNRPEDANINYDNQFYT